MKTQLLIGSALLVSMTFYSQSSKPKHMITGKVNMVEKLASKYSFLDRETEKTAKASPSQNVSVHTTEEAPLAATTTSANWQVIAGSMNVYGMLVSNTRPLNYNDNLNAVSFVHRKGGSSTTFPFDNTGSIIERYTTNWGTTWDSTCIWTNTVQLARYPQGGIYNPPGNTDINNAYGVGMGPVTHTVSTNGWVGNWYASKQLNAANNNFTSSAVPGATQYIANTPPYNTGLAKHDFSRYSFSATDDGAIRSAAVLETAINDDANNQQRGFGIIKGSFNAGTFTWTSDTLKPSCAVDAQNSPQYLNIPYMAWNESGTHGYFMCIGAAATATGANRSFQPIVYKTTNSGASWSQVAGINFNDPAFKWVLDHTPSCKYDNNRTLPWFDYSEGIDMTVDANNKLHIGAILRGGYSWYDDSLGYTGQYGDQKYSYPHSPGARMYLYDFYGDGSSAWSFKVIDSLGTEGPGSATTDGGYGDNPWDIDPSTSNSKVTSDSRLQLSRTPDGQYIIYTFAESDTSFTASNRKWNTLPNIKARLLNVAAYTVSPTEINVTRPTSVIPGLSNKAFFHYTSATSQTAAITSVSVTVKVPMTVTNNTNTPLSQLTENRHWFAPASLDFLLLSVSIPENTGSINNFRIYPNPANNHATVVMDLNESGKVSVQLFNVTGQLIRSQNITAQPGQNTIDFNVEDLPKGLYMVNVKSGNSNNVRKLIVE